MKRWIKSLRSAVKRIEAARLLLVALLLIGVSAAGGCKKSKPSADDAPGPTATTCEGSGHSFNVVLISLDTTRADHLACYGHPFISTPNIDRLAAEGTLFLQCTSPAPITLPSHSSMMTATYPPTHGVRNNGTFLLHPANFTLAEALKTAGYATAAEAASFILNREFGLNQGFDVYNDKYSNVQLAVEDDRFKTSRPAEDVCDSALTWLRSTAKEPFFLFLHFFDPHQPCDSPDRFRSRYEDKYVAAIAYVDEQIGRFLAALEELDLDGRTLVVLTGDHGEGRGQHGEDTHAAFIYDSTLTVPLIFRCRGVVPSGRRIEAQVRLVDIAPTILEVLGEEVLPDAQGVSLMPLITGKRQDLHLAAYSESFYPMYDYGMSHLRCLRQDGWKYILAPKSEIYHVVADPGELRNLVAEQPERAARMREEIRKFLADTPTVLDAAESHVELTPQATEALRALGYVGSSAAATSRWAGASELDLFEPRGPDPKDHVELIDLTSHAVGLVHENNPDAAKALKECLAKAPNPDAGFSWAYSDLGYALLKQGDYEEAVKWYRKALEVAPNDSRTMTALGSALEYLGKLDDAIALHEAAVKVKPVFAQTYAALGSALAAKGRSEEAIEQFRAALRIDPKLTYVHRGLGNLYAQVGREAEAVASYEQALRLAPDKHEFRLELAGLLSRMGRSQEAITHCQQVLLNAPNNALAHKGLGDAYLATQRPDEASVSYRRALAINAKCAPASESLSLLLAEQDQIAEAIEVLKKAVAASPDELALSNNLAWLLATAPDAAVRDGQEAVRLAAMVNEASGGENPSLLDTLAAAYAEVGRFDEAVAAAAKGWDLASKAGDQKTAAAIRTRLDLYEKRQPYRQP